MTRLGLNGREWIAPSTATTVGLPETVALDLTRAECGRSPRPGETWRVLFADIGEAVTYCPECVEREFGEAE